MNSTADMNRELTAWLSEEAPSHAPSGILDRAVTRSANVAQKPAWRFVEAWIPRQATMRMATVSRGALYAVLILALALLLAVAAFVVGQQHRLPPPVGLAANGLIADDSNGQIRLISPTGDVVRTITDSRVIALAPAFSADGQKLAYWSIPRTVDLPLSAPIDDQWAAVQDSPASLMVVNVDGGSPTAIATNVDVNNPGLQWSHAGDVIAYEETFATDAHANVVIASTTGAAPPVKISLVATPVWSPDDKLIALSRPNQGLFVVDRDGNNLRPVGQAYGMDAAFGWPDWSPDGSKLVYFTGAAPGYTVHTINIDGSGDRLIAAADGDIWAYWPRFSPDGSKVSYIRPANGGGSYVVIANSDGSDPRQFPIILEQGGGNGGFSPDGRYLVGFDYARANIVLIDTASGAIQLIPSKGMGNASWQRLPLP